MPKLFVVILSKSTDGLTFSPLWFCGCVHRVGPKEVYSCEYTVYSCTIYLFIMVLFSICTVSYFCLTLWPSLSKLPCSISPVTLTWDLCTVLQAQPDAFFWTQLLFIQMDAGLIWDIAAASLGSEIPLLIPTGQLSSQMHLVIPSQLWLESQRHPRLKLTPVIKQDMERFV